MQEELQKFVSLSSWNPEVYPVLAETVVCATILPHRNILSYIQVQCCPPPPQLHSNFADFISAVWPVTKITVGEINPDTNLSTANILPEPHVAAWRQQDASNDSVSSVFLPGMFQVACIYNDHSLYVWDVLNTRRVGKAWSFLFHSGCVWGLEVSNFDQGIAVFAV